MRKRTWIWITVGCSVLFLCLIGAFIFAVATIGFSGGSGLAGDWQEHPIRQGSGNRILLIEIDGTIMSTKAGTPLGPVGTSSNSIISQLDQAVKDESLKAIVLKVNSPGGEVVASDAIYRKLREVREETGLPIVASFGSTAASGGLYVAMAADRIVSNPLSMTGSIGVIMTSYNYGELADKLGIEEVVIKSGAFKDMGSPTRDVTEEELDIYQSMVDESYDRFVEVVAQGRDLPQDDVREFADGRVMTGRQAEAVNLVDTLGSLDDAIATAEQMAGVEDAQVISYMERFGFSSLLGMTKKDESFNFKQISALDLLKMVRPPGLMYLHTTN